MKLSFSKRDKDTDKRFWFSSSRKSSLLSLESFLERKSWNFLKKRHKTPDHPPLDSQSTIIIEDSLERISLDSKKPQVIELVSVVEPIEIPKSNSLLTAQGNSQSLHQSDTREESRKNVFTPRLGMKNKRSGKVTPEFRTRSFRRPGATTPTDFSTSWNSIPLRLPPPLTPPLVSSSQELKSNTTACDYKNPSIKASVNSIFQKLLNDPSLKSRIITRKITKTTKKITKASLKHLPVNEPLSSCSNLEVFEQDLPRRSTKRAWTSSSADPRKSSLSWISSSLTLNALSLPTLVIPSNLTLTHLRDFSEHNIELSSLGSNVD